MFFGKEFSKGIDESTFANARYTSDADAVSFPRLLKTGIQDGVRNSPVLFLPAFYNRDGLAENNTVFMEYTICIICSRLQVAHLSNINEIINLRIKNRLWHLAFYIYFDYFV